MLLIPCPWCGPREELEFRFGDQSHICRPGPSVSVSDRTWAEYLFTRINPKGVNLERWNHKFGCGRWFNVARDTLTHRIVETYEMNATASSAPEEAARSLQVRAQ